MDIFSVAALGIVGALLAVTVKNAHPELGIVVSLTTACVILLFVVDGLGEIVSEFSKIVEKSGINTSYFYVALKACVIAYVTQLAAELCRDAGEGAVAVKVEMAGKISVVVLSLPVVSGFLEAIEQLI